MPERAPRAARSAVTVVVAVLLLAGTFFGDDDDFPFGPFRMYSTRAHPDGAVVSTRVEATDARGRTLVVPPTATGLRRAEIEGQMARFVGDPSLLGELAEAHDRLRPHESPYQEVRVVERRQRLRNSGPTGEQQDRVVVVWRRS